LSPDQRFVGFVAFRFPFEIWDFRTGEKAKTLPHDAKERAEYAWGPDSKTLMTIADTTLLIRDWPSCKPRRSIDLGPKQYLYDVRVSADGKRVEVLTNPRVARRFDLDSGKELDDGPAAAHSNIVRSAVVAADGKIVTLGDDKTIRVWDPKTGRQQQCHSVDAPDYPWQLALNADGRLIATINRGDVLVYELDSGKLLGKLGMAQNGLISMDFHPREPVLRVRTHDQPGRAPVSH
jgi:WD40 repeat protein